MNSDAESTQLWSQKGMYTLAHTHYIYFHPKWVLGLCIIGINQHYFTSPSKYLVTFREKHPEPFNLDRGLNSQMQHINY